MRVRRFRIHGLTAAFAAALLAPGTASFAQTAPQAVVTPPAFTPRDSAIVKPLAEIGRVRARTPYCAALAGARPGIDAAITFEYLAPQLVKDLRGVRFDSELHRELALRKADADLAALGQLSTLGRAEVLALRTAAYADGVDEQKRQEMLGLANAIDGAKERQKMLAKRIARLVGAFHEAPVHTIVTTTRDQGGSTSAAFGKTPLAASNPEAQISEVSPQAAFVTQDTLDTIAVHDRAQDLFQTFMGEARIRTDMEDAAQHAKLAMQLGNCSR
ncbi:MAG TPA: hypothetical protein VHS78_04520 [Candidatus Elarobacter sp.]|jgi:hypothetical protein|nr:hypothetical protein [Candidatus Elarobacter sp.]